MSVWASWGLRPAVDLVADAPLLRARRQGVIVTSQQHLVQVSGRWWPLHGSWLMAIIDRRWPRLPHDTCQLFYHESWGSPGFIALAYARAGRGTRPGTLKAALDVLDEIARLRRAHAIVAHLTDTRMTDRLVQRWGWERHLLQSSQRHVIRRFYGEYPDPRIAYRRMPHYRESHAASDVDARNTTTGLTSHAVQMP